MGSSLGATLMSLWGWVSEASRTGPRGEPCGMGLGQKQGGGRDLRMAPTGWMRVGLRCFEPFPFV